MKRTVKKVCRTLKKSMSLLLAFSMMISVCIISGFSVSGASTYFSSGKYIYVSTIDLANSNTSHSISKIKCHMYSGWPEDKNDDGTDKYYVDSIEMQKISDNYYRCFILADNIKYLKFMINDNTSWWIQNGGKPQYSIDPNDNDNNPCGSSSNNCVYIKNASANSTSWGSINSNDPDNTFKAGTYQSKTASLSNTIKNNVGDDNGELALVDATFYDYYNNDEIRKGWISGLDGSERSYIDREPFTFFNRAVANYASSNTAWSYPLYFGDFNTSNGPWGNGYSGAGVSNLYNYKARANNSNATSSGVNGAVSGLVDQTLNGTITSGKVELPYFSTSFLKNGYGATVNSKFVFRNEERTNSDGTKDMYHVYDSTGGKDNFFFSNVTSSPVAYYYKNSYRIKDAASGFGGSSNGYGFFPFDQGGSDAKDFGFGMRLDIPFTLREDGKTSTGHDVVFNFSGDDDLWVYVDNKLVLDLGGAHKMATGSINFTTRSISVQNLDTTYGTKTASLNFVEYGKAHTMTIFYMERGMVESNLKVEYNFEILKTSLEVTKALDTADVVSAIADELKENENYNYTISDNDSTTTEAGKDYKLNGNNATLGESGSFTLQDSDSAMFDDTFKHKSNMTVNESIENSALSYDTSWTLSDVSDETAVKTISTGSDTKSEFELVDPDSDIVDAKLKLDYVNKIKTGKLDITKDVVDENGNSFNTDQLFTFELSLDLDGEGTKYSSKTYPLEYKISGDNNTYTMSDGRFSIAKGQTITVLGLPVGATYTLEEFSTVGFTPSTVSVSGGTAETFNGTITGTVKDSATNATINVVNKIVPINTEVAINKSLDGSAYTGSMFSYTITGLGSMETNHTASDGSKIKSISTSGRSQTVATPADGGVVKFDDKTVLKFVEPGCYRFKITESFADSSNSENANYVMDESTIFVEIEINSSGELQTPKYYKVSNADISSVTEDAGYADVFNNNTFVTQTQTLENTTKHGSVTVIKKNQNDSAVKDTVFALIKVSEEDIITDEVLNSIISNNSDKIVKETTDDEGKAVFDNLVIFEDGNGEFTKGADGAVAWATNDNYLTGSSSKQIYCLFEYSPADGYNPNYVRQYFTLPEQSKYDVTFDYVDGLIVTPNASGSGMSIFFTVGLGIIGTGTLLAAGYIIYCNIQRKKRRAKHAQH